MTPSVFDGSINCYSGSFVSSYPVYNSIFELRLYTVISSIRTSMETYTTLLFCSSLLSISLMSTATDTITTSQSLRDSETVVSAGGSFELGFFSPGISTRRYLGIWYKKISTSHRTVVWVANREIPLLDSYGVLKVSNEGILVLLNRYETIIWSSNSSRLVINPVARLLETGNLVVKDANDDDPENFLWQSFDYPGDTLLPTMKLGKNMVTGLDRYISSWKSTDDPSRGDYTFQLDPRGYPEFVARKGSVEQFRSGPWNGRRFGGYSQLKQNPVYKFGFVYNQEEIYYSYELRNSSIISRLVINPYGILQRFTWVGPTQRWVLYLTSQVDSCDRYALCGAYGSCDIDNSPMCGCLKGFVPKFPKDWDMLDWSQGCVRKVPLNCHYGDGFNKYSRLKLPETQHSWYNDSMNLEECRIMCLKNCSCTAHAILDITREIGCLLWFGGLIDMREYSELGQEIYIRMPASELDQGDNAKINANSNVRKRERIIIIAVLCIAVLVLGLALMFFVWTKKQNRARKVGRNKKRGYPTETEKKDLELPSFDMATLAIATNNFSINNKLGEGGFGPVYKGVLEDGQEIAVKRLSKNSRQGLSEFKNEVIHIAKLQHRNLVKLLGCCIQVDEKMLIYEFMPNKSLDYFIFDHTRSILLNWSKRFHIIKGVAHGLLYLHRDSRLRIIHRDLKAGNILLDNEMNPKISDFGLARSFGGNESAVNTNKVVGTYGYMSPEYAIDGMYSIKSDVFSFGVLLLEIVSGKRNRGFHHSDHHLNLIGHAWRLHIDGRSLELVDASMGNSYDLSELLRSIHVGLLCVQRSPEVRPNMSSVVLMLGSEGSLPQPKQPGFFAERNLVEADSSTSKREQSSTNEITITLLEGR